MRSPEPNLVDRLLIEGLVDWLDAGWVYSEAMKDGIAPEGVRTWGLGAIAELLFRDLAVAGDVDDDGFHAWSTETAEAFARIALGWLAFAPGEIRPGDVFWLRATPAGKERGRLALEQVGPDGWGDGDV